jgi:hypothetical protein
MAVSSANELVQSLRTLQGEYMNMHIPSVQNVINTVDAHVNSLVDDGKQWISAQTTKLYNDWQTHKTELNNVLQHFEDEARFIGPVIDAVEAMASIAGG